MTAEPSGPALARRLTTADAVVIGVGSMVGAGLFSAFAPAARAAGALLLLALGVAALVAFCNAASSAQLAAQYPTSGGTYVYGRERLGPWWGFVAGWGFVIGKTASCAAMALVLAVYVVPEPWQKPVAVAAVVTLAAVNYRGITRTARLTRLIVALVLVLLAVVLVAVAAGGGAGPPAAGMGAVGLGGVLQGAAILFFAFAGYARIATLGEEVVDPARTIPRAILGAFAVVVPLYAVTGLLLLRTLGVDALASSPAPLRDAAATVTSGGWLQLVVVVAAAAATLGALLALVAGVGRTALAMAREGDLPRPLAAVHPRYAVPHVAEVTVAVVVCALVLLTDLRSAIGFSSFGVLTYYAVANAAALTQQRPHRRYPGSSRWWGCSGASSSRSPFRRPRSWRESSCSRSACSGASSCAVDARIGQLPEVPGRGVLPSRVKAAGLACALVEAEVAMTCRTTAHSPTAPSRGAAGPTAPRDGAVGQPSTAWSTASRSAGCGCAT